jgi:hypothetical protein
MPRAFVHGMTGATAAAPKMDEVVCAHKFFKAKGDEADFASDYTSSHPVLSLD